MARKIRLGFSPYAFARISAMKGKLLRRADYDRLAKMGYNEALRFLQESNYREDIVARADRGDIEYGLNAHLMRTYTKLMRIGGEGLDEVVRIYTLRYDMENFKIVLRALAAQSDKEQAKALLYDTFTYPRSYFEGLLEEPTLLHAVEKITLLAGQENDLFSIENALDRYYLEELTSFASRIRGQGKLLALFLHEEVEALNLKTALRLLSEGEEGIEQYLVGASELCLQVARSKDVDSALGLIFKQGLVAGAKDSSMSLSDLEIALDVRVLVRQAKLMHSTDLSATKLLGYMFAKAIEVRNLKVILKAKQLGLAQHYVEKLVVSP